MTAHPLVPLGQLATAIESGFACGKSRLVEHGLVHLRPFNIGRNGEVDMTQEYRVPPDAAPLSKASLCAGDILFNNTNSPDLVGKTAVVRENLDAGFSNHVTRIRLDPDRCDPSFVAAYMRRLWLQGHFRDHCTQWVSQAAYGKRLVADLHVPLPPLDEQRRIVDILNRAARIEALRRRAAERLREFVPALFVRMFGDPVENPMGWQVRALADLVKEFRYGTTRKCYDSRGREDGVPVLRIPNILHGRVDWTDLRFASLRKDERDNLNLERGDILFVRSNGNREYIGRCAIFDGECQAAYYSHLIRARLADRGSADPVYVSTCLGLPTARQTVLRLARTTAGSYNVSIDNLGRIRIPVPPLALQLRYVGLVKTARAVARVGESGTRTAAALMASLVSVLLQDGVSAHRNQPP